MSETKIDTKLTTSNYISEPYDAHYNLDIFANNIYITLNNKEYKISKKKLEKLLEELQDE